MSLRKQSGVKCEICGRTAYSKEEKDLLERYGCLKTQITNQGYSTLTEMCWLDRKTGKFHPPSTTRPETFQEDPDALKENFKKKYERGSKRDPK